MQLHNFLFVILGVDISYSVHVDSKRKDIIVLGKSLTKGLNETTIIQESKYTINFIRPGRRFVLSLHYNETKGFFFVYVVKKSI